MAVNNSFYSTVNELMKRAGGSAVSAVVDYATFVDAGTVLSSLSGETLQNEFMTPLMNKVQKTINDNPAYTGMLIDIYAGKLDYGTLEMIMGTFYDMQASVFDGATLSDGQTYTDQFAVSLPEKKAMYYTDSNSYQRTITVRDTDLRGAFKTPEAMDAFIASIFLDIANSLALSNEVGRLNLLASVILTCAGTTPETSEETAPSQYYKLLTIYNSKMGTSLTASDCLYNTSFVLFAKSTIDDIAAFMAKPEIGFNKHGDDATPYKTFTPQSYLKLKINSIFEKAIKTAKSDTYHDEYLGFNEPYEALPYWQNSANRLKITTNTTAASATAYSDPIIAVLFDKRAIGEMIQFDSVETTRNGGRRYTNYHFQANRMYWRNDYANAVIFALA